MTTEALEALDELESRAREAYVSGPGKTVSDLVATLRAALTPPADDEVEAIRRRHETLEAANTPAPGDEKRWIGEVLHQALTDRATLLRHVDRLSAELVAERERRVEVERIKAAIDEALTMACDERDEAYSQFDKLKEATGPFTWYLSSSVFDDRPDDDVPQTTEDAGRRVPRLGDYRRLRAATLTKDTP